MLLKKKQTKILRVKNPLKKFERLDLKKNINPLTTKKVKEPNKLKKLKMIKDPF